MTIMFMPIFLIWISFWVVIDKKFKSILPLLLSLSLGVGLAAFFIFPAFFEKNLVSTDTLTRGDLNFRAHFVTVDQLFFSRFWGYGAAASNTHQDTISYQIGWPHWWLAFVALIMSIYFGFLLWVLVGGGCESMSYERFGTFCVSVIMDFKAE